jgi:hypothetical protein
VSRLPAELREQLERLPLPTLADGTGGLAAWGVAKDGDGLWQLYTMRDGRTATWEGISSANVRVAIAASALLNARAQE